MTATPNPLPNEGGSFVRQSDGTLKPAGTGTAPPRKEALKALSKEPDNG